MSEQIPDGSPAAVPPVAPSAPVTPSASPKSTSALAITGLVLGIIAVVFSIIPLVNIFTATWLGPLAIVFSAIAVLVILVGKHRKGLVMGIIALVLGIIATAVVFTYTSNVNHALNNLSTSQSTGSNGAGSAKAFPQDVYDSIKVAKLGVDAKGNAAYSGGTVYSSIEGKLPKPSDSSESSVDSMTVVTNTWSDFNLGGKSKVIMIEFDKTSGQIISKSATSF